VHSLDTAPHVKDIRTLGLVAGVELEPRQGAPGQRAAQVFQLCFDDGALIRVTGDTIALSPPLIISQAQIDELVGRIAGALRRVA
jgi:beta-alanine--pyruvate transaminase